MTNNNFELSIPTYRVENMEKMIKKLNKIANKSNSPNIEMIFKGIEVKTLKLKTDEKVYIEYSIYEFNVDGIIGYSGWEFISKLDHTDSVNIISTLPNKSLPQQYFNIEPYCEHCRSKRVRNNTYILRNIISGDYIQVGSSCLAQFLMIDCEKWISMFTGLLGEMDHISDDLDEDYEGGRIPTVYSIKSILEYGMWDIKRFGYVSKKMMQEDYDGKYNLTTAESVQHILFAPKEEFISFIRNNEEELNSYEEKANKIIEYIKGLEVKNEYTHNMVALFSSGYAKFGHIGYIVSAIPLYERDHEVKIDGLNEYYGNVGDKIQRKLTLIKSFPLNTPWGYSVNYIFKDEDGRTFTWFTNKDIGIENGFNVILKGTIKEHKDYKGIMNTVLTRCKVI